MRHGVTGIEGQVHQNLLDLSRVCLDQCGRRLEPHHEVDVLAQQAAEHRSDAVDGQVRVEYSRLKWLLAADGEELRRQLRGSRRGLLDDLDVSSYRISGREAIQRNLTAGDDDGQEVVEIVCDPSGQAPDRLHPLRLGQLLLRSQQLLVGAQAFPIQPRGFEPERRLVGECLCQSDFALVERPTGPVENPEHADHPVLDPEGHGQHRAVRRVDDAQSRLDREAKSRVSEQVAYDDRPTLPYGKAWRADPLSEDQAAELRLHLARHRQRDQAGRSRREAIQRGIFAIEEGSKLVRDPLPDLGGVQRVREKAPDFGEGSRRVLGALALGVVAGLLREPSQGAAQIAHGHGRHAGPESRPVPADPPALRFASSLPRRSSQLFVGRALLGAFAGGEARDVLTDDLLRQIAVEARGADIPRDNLPDCAQQEARIVRSLVGEETEASRLGGDFSRLISRVAFSPRHRVLHSMHPA